jgi:hypothetical protein
MLTDVSWLVATLALAAVVVALYASYQQQQHFQKSQKVALLRQEIEQIRDGHRHIAEAVRRLLAVSPEEEMEEDRLVWLTGETIRSELAVVFALLPGAEKARIQAFDSAFGGYHVALSARVEHS